MFCVVKVVLSVSVGCAWGCAKGGEGASIEEMMQATDWQQHSVRGFLAGTVKRKLGFSLTSLKPNGGVRRYRIETRRGR